MLSSDWVSTGKVKNTSTAVRIKVFFTFAVRRNHLRALFPNIETSTAILPLFALMKIRAYGSKALR